MQVVELFLDLVEAGVGCVGLVAGAGYFCPQLAPAIRQSGPDAANVGFFLGRQGRQLLVDLADLTLDPLDGSLEPGAPGLLEDLAGTGAADTVQCGFGRAFGMAVAISAAGFLVATWTGAAPLVRWGGTAAQIGGLVGVLWLLRTLRGAPPDDDTV